MNEIEKAKKIYNLVQYKGEILARIQLIKNGKHDSIRNLILDGYAERGFNPLYQEKWFNGKRAYKKIKYILIAELEETLEEIQAEINKLVVFKEDEN